MTRGLPVRRHVFVAANISGIAQDVRSSMLTSTYIAVWESVHRLINTALGAPRRTQL